jgi:hypothetical protein
MQENSPAVLQISDNWNPRAVTNPSSVLRADSGSAIADPLSRSPIAI